MTKVGARTYAGPFRRPDKRRGHSVGKALLIVVGMIAMMVGVWGPAARSALASTSGTYNVVGNKIVDPNGAKFVPYGFVVSCLSAPVIWCTNARPHQTSAIAQQVQAAGTMWHANTVRFQVAQEHLFDQAPYDATYLSQLDTVVNQANSLGMVAVISLQEEKYNGPVMPTQSAVDFWNLIAAHYANNPRVFFDLYNEPRLTEVQAGGDLQLVWSIWRNGGTVGGVTYVGMQALVDGIRATGANNIVIAEGTLWATSLLGIPQWALSGTNIAYGIKPSLAGTSVDPQTWYADFGAVASQVPVFPQEFRRQHLVRNLPGKRTDSATCAALVPLDAAARIGRLLDGSGQCSAHQLQLQSAHELPVEHDRLRTEYPDKSEQHHRQRCGAPELVHR